MHVNHLLILGNHKPRWIKQKGSKLMLQESQMSSHNNVLEHGAWWDIDGAAIRGDDDNRTLERHIPTEIDGSSDGEVIELDDIWNAWNAGLEAGNFLEIAAKLDERGRPESVRVHDELAMLKSVEVRFDQHKVRACLDWEEATTGDIDTMGIAEVPDGGTNSRLELKNAYIGITLLVC